MDDLVGKEEVHWLRAGRRRCMPEAVLCGQEWSALALIERLRSWSARVPAIEFDA